MKTLLISVLFCFFSFVCFAHSEINGIAIYETTNTNATQDDQIYTNPDLLDEEAHFPGGSFAMSKYIDKNLKFPEIDQLGRAVVQFVVEKDGSLTRFKDMRSTFECLAKATEELIASMPKWEPASIEGRPVRQMIILKITFNPDDKNHFRFSL